MESLSSAITFITLAFLNKGNLFSSKFLISTGLSVDHLSNILSGYMLSLYSGETKYHNFLPLIEILIF